MEKFDLSLLVPKKKVITLPVSNKEITIKPLTAMDSKRLAEADEKGDESVLEKYSKINHLTDCDMKIENLVTADFEYLVLQLHHSNNKQTIVAYECPECESVLSAQYDVNKTSLLEHSYKNFVEFNNLKLSIKELSVGEYQQFDIETETGVLEAVKHSLHTIEHNDVIYPIDETNRNDIFEQIPYNCLNTLVEYVITPNTIKSVVSVSCDNPECELHNTDETHELQGLVEHFIE